MRPLDMRPWTERLTDLCDRIRRAARTALDVPCPGQVARPVSQGVGDVTYELDACCERVITEWLEECAREGPLSLLTEDAGWRHRGPGSGGPIDLGDLTDRDDPFDHGGPRIAIDPVDGTRNLMGDLRSAWTVISFAGPGPGQPRLADQTLGLVSELPDTRAAHYRVLHATPTSPCVLELRDLALGALISERHVAVDDDDRPDHGYFPFFRYAPELRPHLAAVEAEFFRRLREHEDADTRHCFDDQYICGAGQLILLALGTYRSLVDLRGFVGQRAGLATTTGHPYDVAGAIVCARAAGCVVTDEGGHELDFPIDCTTPVNMIAWTNTPTAHRLAPHLQAALRNTRAEPPGLSDPPPPQGTIRP